MFMQAGLRPFSWSEFKQPADLKSRILLLPPHPKVQDGDGAC